MLLVNSNNFWENIKYKKHAKTNFYLFICSSMFKINKHTLTTFSRSKCLTSETYFDFLKKNYRVPHKTLWRPYVRPP